MNIGDNMQIDITKLLTNVASTIYIKNEVIIPNELLNNSFIHELKNIYFDGKATINEENDLVVSGIINGTMILSDDITLEPVEYKFKTDMEELLDSNYSKIDITDVLWQNILTEIPSKVRATSEDIELSGDGWRVISEDKFKEERNKANNPFANLSELLKKEDK